MSNEERDVNDLPEVLEFLRGASGLEAAGFRENEYGEFIADGCHVNVYPSWGEYEVYIHLPGGGALFFDVASLSAVPQKKK
jgi:hypothetical protein